MLCQYHDIPRPQALLLQRLAAPFFGSQSGGQLVPVELSCWLWIFFSFVGQTWNIVPHYQHVLKLFYTSTCGRGCSPARSTCQFQSTSDGPLLSRTIRSGQGRTATVLGEVDSSCFCFQGSEQIKSTKISEEEKRVVFVEHQESF